MNLKNLLSMLFLLAFWIMAALTNVTAGQSQAKPGCSDTCGNISIPYPFGIGSNCAIHQSYTVNCNSSKPYLNITGRLNRLEVLGVSLGNRTVTVNVPVNHSCSSDAVAASSWEVSVDLAGTPFFYSMTYNRMVLSGCGNAVLSGPRSRILTGCTSTCEFNSSTSRDISGCHGVGCCEAAIPFDLTDYRLNFTLSRFNTRNCSSAFLAERNWSPPPPAGDLRSSDDQLSSQIQNVPVVLAWTLGEEDVTAMYNCPYEMTYLETESGPVETYMCTSCGNQPTISREQVNPYLERCGRTIVDPTRPYNLTKAAVIGVCSSIGSLLLIAATFTAYKQVKRRRDKMIREKYFKRNGGLLLQQQLSSDEGIIEKTRVFGSGELEKATDGFNANMILGQGGQGTVYKGMLADGRIVAIKKSRKVNESQLGQFINEVVILSQVNHRNVVKLLGCCLETEVPLLVYEFIPNGTLFSLIHNQNDDDGDDDDGDQFPFTWNLRLRIANEVAGALAYLHTSTSMPIYHRDVKSSNILLGEKYIAKVSDFGTSRLVEIDRTHLTTQVKGTFGYLDPEYFQSSQFTEKSDVYSFGVVLVELLTRKKPISSSGGKEGDSEYLSLATLFLTSIDKDRLFSVLDPQVVDEGNKEEIVAAAKLAQRCLNLNGRKRPTMKEVAIELESLKLSAAHSIVQENFHSRVLVNEGEISDSVSWTTETVSTSFDSGVYPLLRDTI